MSYDSLALQLLQYKTIIVYFFHYNMRENIGTLREPDEIFNQILKSILPN